LYHRVTEAVPHFYQKGKLLKVRIKEKKNAEEA
jgi:hypothetical protein